MTLQSVVDSPSKRQIDSKAILTAGGGFDIDLTSTRFCFFIDCTAKVQNVDQAEIANKKNKKGKQKMIVKSTK